MKNKKTWSFVEQKAEADIRTCKSNCWTCLHTSCEPDHDHNDDEHDHDHDDNYEDNYDDDDDDDIGP